MKAKCFHIFYYHCLSRPHSKQAHSLSFVFIKTIKPISKTFNSLKRIATSFKPFSRKGLDPKAFKVLKKDYPVAILFWGGYIILYIDLIILRFLFFLSRRRTIYHAKPIQRTWELKFSCRASFSKEARGAYYNINGLLS